MRASVIVAACLLSMSMSADGQPLALRECEEDQYGVDAGSVGTECAALLEAYYCPHMRSGFRVAGLVDTGCMGGSGPDGS